MAIRTIINFKTHTMLFLFENITESDLKILCKNDIALIFQNYLQSLTVMLLNFGTPKNPNIQRKRQNHTIFCPEYANGIANSENPDQTAPL